MCGSGGRARCCCGFDQIGSISTKQEAISSQENYVEVYSKKRGNIDLFMKFSYQFFEGEHLPIIPISMKRKEEWIDFDAYIDTEASSCLFPADVAEILNIPLEKGEIKKVILGDGNTI